MKSIIKFGNSKLDVADPRLDYADNRKANFSLLQGFIEDCYINCRFHTHRFRKNKVSPDEIKSPADLRRIPILDPNDSNLRYNTSLVPDKLAEAMHNNMNSFDYGQRLFRVFHTSGTTGKSKISHYTFDDWSATIHSSSRATAHARVTQNNARTFNCFFSGHIAGKLTEDSSIIDGNIVINRHFSTTDDMSLLTQLYTGLRDIGGFNVLAIPPLLPRDFVSKGGTLDSLLNIDDENYIGRHISHIVTAGFPFDIPEYNLMERVWEANELAGKPKTLITSIYGASEALPLAVSCSEYNGSHLISGNTYVEVIDWNTGKHVESGGRGMIVVTGIRHGSRFLRYALGDEATFIDEPCPCGKKTPRLVEIRRVMDKDRISGGCAAGGLG